MEKNNKKTFVSLFDVFYKETEHDVNAPFGWYGSGCYDVDYYADNILAVTIIAEDKEAALAVASNLPETFLEEHDIPKERDFLGIFEEPRISASENINEAGIDEDNTAFLRNDDELEWSSEDTEKITFEKAFEEFELVFDI